jgi:hypothetical protein
VLEAGAALDVDRVDRHRLHADEYVARAQLRYRQLDVDQAPRVGDRQTVV